MSGFLALLLSVVIISNAFGQGLTDEKQLLEQRSQTDVAALVKQLQIPNDICNMQITFMPSYRSAVRMTFCHYAFLWVQRISHIDPTAQFLPMLKWKPPGQLVEMVGIPTNRRHNSNLGAALFKNSGGQLVLAVNLGRCEYITKSDAKCSDIQMLDASTAPPNNDTMVYFLIDDPR
jgi:hypothetical protein